MSLSDQPGFDTLTPAQRVEVQEWVATRFLATRDPGRRKPITARENRSSWPRPQPMMGRPAYLRDRFPASYKAQSPGSGGLGNQNWRGSAHAETGG